MIVLDAGVVRDHLGQGRHPHGQGAGEGRPKRACSLLLLLPLLLFVIKIIILCFFICLSGEGPLSGSEEGDSKKGNKANK